MQFVVVELEDGEQEFFDSVYDGLKFAKTHEDKRPNTVDYLAII
jgi:hypothetical protein